MFIEYVNSVKPAQMKPFVVAETIGRDITFDETILVGKEYTAATMIHEMLHCMIEGGEDDHEWIYRRTVELTEFNSAIQAHAIRELNKYLTGAYYDPNEKRAS